VVLQQIVSGLATGSLYALAALGLVLIYKTSDVVNFAQGEMAMLSTFVSFTFLNGLHLPYPVSFLLALIFAAAFGLAVERVLMRPVQKAPVLNQIILTLGLYLAFRGIAGMIWGYTPASYPTALPDDPINLGGIILTANQVLILVIAIILMLIFYWVFKKTLIGLAMRAASQNIQTAELMGIRVGSVFSMTWAIGAVLGAVAGMLIAPITFIDPNMMSEVIIIAFASAVLGGFTSLPGAVLGGLIIGVLENFIATYISAELKSAILFLLIILVLYVRPSGILGTKYVKKV
jgi:branched-chain amino acid transport system permease protein